MKSILVCDQWHNETLKLLPDHGVCFSKALTPSKDELLSCEILMIRSKTKVNSQLLAHAPKLKLVISSTSGFDHIDLDACKERQIQVCYTPEANVQSAAELTVLLILSSLKNLNQVSVVNQNKQWKDQLHRASELSQKKVGIIGLGRIGSSVAKIVQAFGSTTYAYDPYISDHQFKEANTLPLTLDPLLKEMDIISLHTPLTPETKHLINSKTLLLMKDNALLINASRGPVVELDQLVQHLKLKPNFKVALDVFSKEPLPDKSVLRSQPNVFITPHIGAYTEEAFKRATEQACECVTSYIKKQTVKHLLV